MEKARTGVKRKRFVIFPQKSYWIESETREGAVREALKRYVKMIKNVENIDGSLKEWVDKK